MALKFSLPDLRYGYRDLQPHISEEQLRLHHGKHHNAYVNAANGILEKVEGSRKKAETIDMTSVCKSLSFNMGGHILHSLFWDNLSPTGGGEPKGAVKKRIETEFGSFQRFRLEFDAAALVEGSGWAALGYHKTSQQLLILQLEKHNVNMIPDVKLLLVLDMWEHAYYIDYRNEKSKYIEAFWNMVNWEEVDRRYKEQLV